MTTRFPKGINNMSPESPFSALPFPNPFKWHVFAEDFNGWPYYTTAANATAANGIYYLTATAGGAGSTSAAMGTSALTSSALQITTDDAAGDGIWATLNAANAHSGCFGRLVAGKRLFVSVKVRPQGGADQTDSVFLAGAYEPAIAAFNVASTTHGLYFYKADAAATYTCVWSNGTTQVQSAALGSFVLNTSIDLVALYLPGERVSPSSNSYGVVRVYVNDVLTARMDVSSAAVAAGNGLALTPAFGYKAGAVGTVAYSCGIDYLMVAAER
jgi:hypothetical protein